MIKAEISSIEEEFEKARTRGAKDKLKRKRKNVSVRGIMEMHHQGLLTKKEALSMVSKISGWEGKVKSYIRKYEPWKKEKLERI